MLRWVPHTGCHSRGAYQNSPKDPEQRYAPPVQLPSGHTTLGASAYLQLPPSEPEFSPHPIPAFPDNHLFGFSHQPDGTSARPSTEGQPIAHFCLLKGILVSPGRFSSSHPTPTLARVSGPSPILSPLHLVLPPPWPMTSALPQPGSPGGLEKFNQAVLLNPSLTKLVLLVQPPVYSLTHLGEAPTPWAQG